MDTKRHWILFGCLGFLSLPLQQSAVDVDGWRAKCWGCGWAGDAIKFVQDQYGLSFADALAQLESGHTGDLAATPRRREKQAMPRREVEVVE